MKRKITQKLIIAFFAILFGGMTANAQSAWVEVQSVTDVFPRDMCFVPGTNGLWQTGWMIAYSGEILKTEDGGDTWTEISQTESSQLAGISFADETTGFICTLDNKILKSDDGGTTWTTIYNGSVNFDKIAFANDLDGVASGTSKLYTSDGGTTWQTGTGGSTYWDLNYGSNDTYYGVNLGGSLGKSTDGGETWTDIESLGAFAFSVKFLNEDHGFFGGDVSTLMSTQDGGSTWITNTLGDGQDAINSGGYFDMDTVYATGSSGDIFKSTDGGANWANDTSFSDFFPRSLVVTGMNVIFVTGQNGAGDGVIWRKVGRPPIEADFEADETDICAGSSINFTDLSVGNIDSWSWTFEGGTPSASTDQNPTVTYSTPGNYFVKLVVAIGALEDSLTLVDYIHVYELPAKANQPTGATSVCTNTQQQFSTDEVDYAQDYDWELSDANAGTLTWNLNQATLDVSETFTGTFTIKVRATNVCGNGDWSDELSITSYESPADFNLQGGGNYCLGGDGAEITLDGSQTGVDYELFLDGTSTGIVVAGTGSEISFGLLTEEGYYEALGSNGNCELPMTGQIQVTIDYPPLEPATPTGDEVICTETSSDYESEGSSDADSYVWMISPEEAGTITSTDLSATVVWNSEFSGIASISLYGINDCGDGNPSEALEVSVGAPLPVIDGEEMVCDFSSETYETGNVEGSTYTWMVTGGAITEGQGTYMITVDWDGEGNGSIIVTEETTEGCSGDSEEFTVLIDDCTGVDENALNNTFSIHPNPANDFVNIVSGTNMSSISVFSMTGELLESVNLKDKNYRLSTSYYKKGIYLVRIISENKSQTKRLIIE